MRTQPATSTRRRTWNDNVVEDLGEKDNLVEKMPEKAQELDRLMRGYLRKVGGVYRGRDLHTGEVKREFPLDVEHNSWFHQRCYRSRATERFIMPSATGIEYVDVRGEHWETNHWVRGACLYGILPANGLTYATPHPCACFMESVRTAVDCTLKHYLGKEVFFQGSGVSHGVAYTDTLEWLYRLTSDSRYAEAMRWLYEDFSTKEGVRPPKDIKELSYDELKYPDRLWWSHAPHAMEGMHTPIITYAMTGDAKYKSAADNLLMKYDRHDTPGGGVVGDEAIARRLGTSMLPREYCTMVSAVMALNRIAVWTGNLDATRRSESIVLNSAQGARFHPALKAVRYLSHDNQKDASTSAHCHRYLYSSWHSAAPCCSTTAARMMPYYVEGMWFADHEKNALIANYYGPCTVATEVAGRTVRLTEETDYPFSDIVKFVFASDADMTLVLRKPPHCGEVKIAAPNAKVEIASDRVSVTGVWRQGDSFSVTFDFVPQLVSEPNLPNAYHYCWGPLLFSLPLGEERRTIKEFETLDDKPSGFFMWEITPEHSERWDFKFDPREPFAKVELSDGDCDTPWANPPIGLRGRMRNDQGALVDVTLTPLGASLLRRTSFPDRTQPVAGPRREWVIKEE